MNNRENNQYQAIEKTVFILAIALLSLLLVLFFPASLASGGVAQGEIDRNSLIS
jgi:hypothetical protein